LSTPSMLKAMLWAKATQKASRRLMQSAKARV
jgi:hypothetical protein